MPRSADGVAFLITDIVASGASQTFSVFQGNWGFAAAAPVAPQ